MLHLSFYHQFFQSSCECLPHVFLFDRFDNFLKWLIILIPLHKIIRVILWNICHHIYFFFCIFSERIHHLFYRVSIFIFLLIRVLCMFFKAWFLLICLICLRSCIWGWCKLLLVRKFQWFIKAKCVIIHSITWEWLGSYGTHIIIWFWALGLFIVFKSFIHIIKAFNAHVIIAGITPPIFFTKTYSILCIYILYFLFTTFTYSKCNIRRSTCLL